MTFDNYLMFCIYIYIYIYITYYKYIIYIYIYIFHLICSLSECSYGLFRSDLFSSMAFSFNFFPPQCLAYRLLLHLFLKSHKYFFNGSRTISDFLEAILSMESRIWPSKGFLQKRMSCAKQLLWKSSVPLFQTTERLVQKIHFKRNGDLQTAALLKTDSLCLYSFKVVAYD